MKYFINKNAPKFAAFDKPQTSITDHKQIHQMEELWKHNYHTEVSSVCYLSLMIC